MSDETRDKTHAALSQIVSEDGPNILTRWVCIMEIMDENGERQVWDVHSEDLSMSDEIGFLEFQSRCLQPEPYKA